MDKPLSKAQIRAYHTRWMKPATPLGQAVHTRVMIALNATHDLNRQARGTVWEADADACSDVLISCLKSIESELMDWELAQ